MKYFGESPAAVAPEAFVKHVHAFVSAMLKDTKHCAEKLDRLKRVCGLRRGLPPPISHLLSAPVAMYLSVQRAASSAGKTNAGPQARKLRRRSSVLVIKGTVSPESLPPAASATATAPSALSATTAAPTHRRRLSNNSKAQVAAIAAFGGTPMLATSESSASPPVARRATLRRISVSMQTSGSKGPVPLLRSPSHRRTTSTSSLVTEFLPGTPESIAEGDETSGDN